MSDALRIQYGMPEEGQEQEEAPRQELARVHDGAMRMNPASGQSEHVAQVRVSSDSLMGALGTGILATAQTPWGSPATKLSPETLVDIGGIMAPLRVAEMEGYVRRDESGRYVEVPQAEREATPQPRGQDSNASEETGEPETFKPETEAALAAMAGDVSTDVLNSVMVSLAIQAAKTGSLAVNLEEVVSRTGMEPERAKAFFGTAIGLLQEQAKGALDKLQVDGEQFLQWAMQERPAQLKQAFVNHVRARSLAGYRALAKDFLRNTAPDMESLQQAGYEVKADGVTKEPMVKIQGAWMSVKSAARQGLL